MAIVLLFGLVVCIWGLVSAFYFVRFFSRSKRGEGRWLQSLMIATLCAWPVMVPAQKLAWFPRTPISVLMLISIPHGLFFIYAIWRDIERGGS